MAKPAINHARYSLSVSPTRPLTSRPRISSRLVQPRRPLTDSAANQQARRSHSPVLDIASAMGFASAGCLVHGTRDVGQGGKKRKSRSRQAGRRQDLGQGTPSLPLECPFQPRCERRPANGASRAPVTPPRRTPSTTPAPWPNDLIPTLAGPASHSTSQNRCQPCRRGKSVGVRQKQVCALPARGSSSHASCGRCFGPGCATPSCSGCVVFKTPCPLPELGERERASPSQSLCPPCANRASSCVAYDAQKLVA